MQVTIALLPVSLSLVHVPRARLHALSHPILRQILHPHPAFLNITCNEIELSLFAEHHMLRDFEPIARKDRNKQRSRSGSASSRKGSSSQPPPPHEPVEISYDKWSVLQIDSHSDQIDNSGTRVHDLSAPLAAAGISILYQSSYMSDFIFVKESRLQEAMDLFESAGFHLYTSDANPPLSPSYSPIADSPASADYTPHHHQAGAVLTRNISDHDIHKKSVAAAAAATASAEPLQSGQQSPRTKSKSHSPTSGEVRMLQPDLACVGLSDELGVDHWGLKIVKLVAFPDLIPPSRSATYSSYPSASSSKKPRRDSHTHAEDLLLRRPSADGGEDGDSASCSSSSSSSSEDGYFSHSPQNVSTASLTSTNASSRSASDLHALYTGGAAANTGATHKTPSKHFVAHVAPMSPIHPPVSSSAPPLSVLTSSPASNYNYNSTPKPTRPLVSSPTSLPPASSLPTPSPSPSGVPFFSFTRTPEGSSLTADVNVLAALFPPHERHMVICGGELDAADARVRRREARAGRAREARRRGSNASSGWAESEDDLDEQDLDLDGEGERERERERQGRSRRRRSASESSDEDADADDDGDGSRRGSGGGGALKALQIDLRRFGLDKHGLVNRFSRVLEENGINHMYSSTFKTANLLVDKSDAVRAQSLLRSC